MKRNASSSRKKKNKNSPLPTANSSKIPNKSEVSTANSYSQILFKVVNNNSKSKSTFRTSKRKDNSSTTKKLWYFNIYAEPNQKERRRRKEKERTRKSKKQKVRKRPEETAEKSHQAIREPVQRINGRRTTS